MWEKIKNIFAWIGIALTALFSVLLGIFIHKSNKKRISDIDEQLGNSTERLGEITDGLNEVQERTKSDSERIAECKEILECARKRAEMDNN